MQQDLAPASLLDFPTSSATGIIGVDGLGQGAVPPNSSAFTAHPDLYEATQGSVRLAIRNGSIALGSPDVPGFASGGTGLGQARAYAP